MRKRVKKAVFVGWTAYGKDIPVRWQKYPAGEYLVFDDDVINYPQKAGIKVRITIEEINDGTRSAH